MGRYWRRDCAKETRGFFSLRGCLGKVDIPEDEEELFIDAVTDHVMKGS